MSLSPYSVVNAQSTSRDCGNTYTCEEIVYLFCATHRLKSIKQ